MNSPIAIILADQPLEDDLEIIFGSGQTASLMIAGNPLIEHILMELQDMRIQQCFVLACNNAKSIQETVGDTERWGMDMRIEVMNYSISREKVWREFKSLGEPNGLLVIEADRLRSHCLQAFVSAAVKSKHALLEAHAAGQALGVTMLKQTTNSKYFSAKPIHLVDVLSNELGSTRDFHRANFDLVAGKFGGLSPSVRMNTDLNRFQHWASKVHRKSSTDGNVMIAENCRVGRNTSLNSVILNHDVFIENNTSLNNTIVMPNSVICASTPINDAIVNQNKVYQLA